MKFSIAAVVAFAASVLARPAFTTMSFEVHEGEPFTLEWIDATSPVTIILMEGHDKDKMTERTVLASGITEESFTWTPENLPSGHYAFKIHDEDSVDNPNYSMQFPYKGTAVESSSTVESSTSTSASESSTTTVVSSSTVTSETTTTTEASSSTLASSTLSTAPSSTSGESEPTAPPNTNNSQQRFSSPLALLLVTAAALVFFN